MSRIWCFFTLLIAMPLLVSAQEKKEEKWDVNNPPGPFQEVTFTTREGTWMNLDLSPDGKTIVFDLLGDIYSLHASGGKAICIRQGLAWEVQPRFSPDGKKLLFTSDAGGGDNIWTMNPDGTEAKQLTKETFRLLNNPCWTPDGNYFIARKHFTSGRSLGAGELWMYHISGGEGVQLTKRKNDQQDVNEPSVSPDGRYVYFSEDMYPGGSFQYNKDPSDQIYAIRRYDMREGKVEEVVGGPGGAARPQISHDGKKLAYVRRVRVKSELYVYDLETGETTPLFDGLSKDQQEAWAVFGAYTGFSWTPDDKYLVIWGQGKLWKVDAETGKAENIPFEVEAKHRITEALHFENPVFTDRFTAKVIRHAVTSPDEKTLVFNAVGHLWKKALPDGTPVRLTQDNNLESEPAISPDGRYLAYVTWDDEQMGSIRKLDLQTGDNIALTSEKGIYRTPSFSPDGRTLVYQKEAGNLHQGFTYCQNPGIYTIPATGGEPAFVCREGEYPVFNRTGDRIYYQNGGTLFGSITKSYHSVKPDGSDVKKHFEGQYAQRFALSPDNRWVAWSELYKVYVAPMPQTGQPVVISSTTKAVPVAQVARDAGINLHWSADSKKLFWMLGEEYFSDELTERFLFLEGARDSIPPMDTAGLKVGLELPMDQPKGVIAFTNARLITMEGDQVIEKGTLVVEGNRILELGQAGKVIIPRGAKVVDCTGKTIMPGLIDVHGHLGNFRYGLSPQKQWEYFANLAYGITTAHDPSTNTEMAFAHSEMIKAGEMTGPRLYSTGTILYGADGDFKAVVNNLEDARSALRRTKAYGAFSVKSYNQPRRDQRQQIITAGRELGMLVVPEGGSFFYHNMSMIADGHTSIEHNVPVAPLYDDVIQFWAQSKTHNTPTLIVTYGGINGEYFFYQESDIWKKQRLLAFTPRGVIDSRARHRTMAPQEEYENGHMLVSQSCKKLQDAGVPINLGSHGQLQGLGAHWELWMFVQGGMTNMQALRAVTMNGAVYLGMDKEIGSLKEGKLADLIVLDKNPLENIRNSEFVRYTMINGRLFDAATMNETGNYNRKRTQFFFEMEGSSDLLPYDSETLERMLHYCGCRH